jgi:2-dehydropantoate 2-reductase
MAPACARKARPVLRYVKPRRRARDTIAHEVPISGESDVRIAVIGAGALGSVLGSLLWRAGEDVVLVGRAAHVAAIRAAGLSVEGVLGGFRAAPHAEERLSSKPELALLTVKTPDIVAALRENAALLEGVPVVVVQNGLRGEELAASVVPAAQLVSAVVALHAEYLVPGRVALLHSEGLLVGRPDGRNDELVERVRSVLDKALPTAVSANIRGARWAKLIARLGDAVPALCHARFARADRDPYLRSLAAALAREGAAVAARAGVRLEPTPGACVPRRGRPSAQIDDLNGEIVRLGARLGVPAPLNERVMALAQRLGREAHYLTARQLRDAFPELQPDANLLVSYARGHYGRARREIARLLGRFGDPQPGVAESGVPGLCVVHTCLDGRQAVARCAGLARAEPQAFSFTIKWVPVDYWCGRDLEAIGRLIEARVAPRIGAQETWAMQVEKRGWARYRTADMVGRLAAAVDRKVSLKGPDRLVRIDVVGSAVAVSLLRPGEVFSIHALQDARRCGRA